ncbi:hypothetical protein RRG08_020608 [Elysia crispata]|uniref:Secreted protein n=1 Tax=Elysia crispata TaxID=231223 RepID=A0AAE1DFM3_9GAST|nr:hypothetical protein RRG08_020608 [Elysia crispata]
MAASHTRKLSLLVFATSSLFTLPHPSINARVSIHCDIKRELSNPRYTRSLRACGTVVYASTSLVLAVAQAERWFKRLEDTRVIPITWVHSSQYASVDQ